MQEELRFFSSANNSEIKEIVNEFLTEIKKRHSSSEEIIEEIKKSLDGQTNHSYAVCEMLSEFTLGLNLRKF
jgi:hypothetical protein